MGNAWPNLQKSISMLFQPFMTSPRPPHIPELFIHSFAPTYAWFLVESWARFMQSCDDAAQCFVERVVHCKCEEDKQHEFLRFEISSPAASKGSHTAIVFADQRQGFEKKKSAILSPSPAQSPSETLPTNDIVWVAVKGYESERSLKNQFSNYIELRTLAFPHHVSRPSAQYLSTLLQTTSAHGKHHKLYANQCYWFAHAVFESLQILHPSALLSNGCDHKKCSQYCGSDFLKADDVDTVVADFQEAWKDFLDPRRVQMAEQQLLLERGRAEGRAKRQEELKRLESETNHLQELERQRLEHEQQLERLRLEYEQQSERQRLEYKADLQQLLARIEAVQRAQ